MPAAPTALKACLTCHVFDAADMPVVAGANAGDVLGGLGGVCLGDVYEFTGENRPHLLALCRDGEAAFIAPEGGGTARVADGSEIGTLGERVVLEGRLTFMAPDGGRAEILLIALAGDAGHPAIVFLPLDPLEPGSDYTLIAAETDPGPVTPADLTWVALTRGTRLLMADGSQRPVEELRPGDLVQTRDNGAQPLRHIVARTVRAVGTFAPVAIRSGALGNAEDLVVSQHQRLFILQTGPFRVAERPEILVRARDLADGDAIAIRRGGHCDYVSLVLDRHEVVYAACIPVESLLVTPETLRQMPPDARSALTERLPGLSQEPMSAAEPRRLSAEVRAALVARRSTT